MIIHGPMPTPEQMADALGVSRSHLANLREVLEKDGFLDAKRAIQKSAAMNKRPRVSEKLPVKGGSSSSLMSKMIVQKHAKSRPMPKKEIIQGTAVTSKKSLNRLPSEVHGQGKVVDEQKNHGQKT